MNIITILLCASLTRHCVDDVKFTVYQQSEPKRVVFLMGGTGTNDEYFFKDLSIYDEYKDTLFVGIGQSYRLNKDIGIVIDWINENYKFPNREQWSFCGFSLGSYQVYRIAMTYYHDVFGNYCAIGGGIDTKSEENPEICFLYVCYGDKDIDKVSAEFGVDYLSQMGYITKDNFKRMVLLGVSHSLEEMKTGLRCFMNELEIRYTSKWTVKEMIWFIPNMCKWIANKE